LTYLAVISRSDIAFSVAKLSQNNANPSTQNLEDVNKIFRYLKGTSNFKITYTKSKHPKLEGYSDSDWAGDQEERKSTSGYLFKLAGAAISWSSKKQRTIALSSTEAEYIAAAEATQELI